MNYDPKRSQDFHPRDRLTHIIYSNCTCSVFKLPERAQLLKIPCSSTMLIKISYPHTMRIHSH